MNDAEMVDDKLSGDLDSFALKFKTMTETAQIPERQTERAAGFDLHADENKRINPGELELISTGVKAAIPPGYVGIIKPRSGHAVDERLTTDAGVIDSDYRGEVVVALRNDSTEYRDIDVGERVAQLLVMPIMNLPAMETDELPDTERGADGFGSTGDGGDNDAIEDGEFGSTGD